MKFKKAVERPPEINHAWHAGFQAITNVDKSRVDAQDVRRLTGSIHLDRYLNDKYPNAPRWDYAVGHHPNNRNDDLVYWIEVHPAADGEVKVVLAKLQWLRTWLREKAPELDMMRKEYVWVSSGKTSFTQSSPQQKQFALAGLQQKGRFFKIPNDAKS